MKIKLNIRLRNKLYPGYSACSKCGGNWGWKKGADHMTGKHSGLFLFCEECDKIVTVKERWKALNEWKKEAIMGIVPYANRTLEETKEEIKRILDTEFIEFPRKKSK